MKTRKKKRTVIKNRKRFTLFLTVMVILTCCGFSSVKKHVTPREEMDAITILVSNGDTLWSIASDYNEGNEDIRKLVHRIKKYNNLKSYTIYDGDEILIPV